MTQNKIKKPEGPKFPSATREERDLWAQVFAARSAVGSASYFADEAIKEFRKAFGHPISDNMRISE